MLENLRPGLVSDDLDAFWMPLQLPCDAWGSVMIQRVRRDLEEVATAIKIAIDTFAETELAGAGTSVQPATAAVMGI